MRAGKPTTMEDEVTASHVTLAVLLSMLLALGMACKGSESSAAQSSTTSASTSSGEEPAATAPKSATDEVDDKSQPAPVRQDHDTPAAPGPGRADVEQFQALFAPIWNTKAEAERAKRACDAAGALKTRVEAIDKRSPPTGADEETWLSSVERLQDYVGEIGVYCEDGADADTDGILELVANAQERLQAVTEMLPR